MKRFTFLILALVACEPAEEPSVYNPEAPFPRACAATQLIRYSCIDLYVECSERDQTTCETEIPTCWDSWLADPERYCTHLDACPPEIVDEWDAFASVVLATLETAPYDGSSACEEYDAQH